MDEEEKIQYASYNGLGRAPQIWRIPYMPGLAVVSTSLLLGQIAGTLFGGAGWMLVLIAVPMLGFIKLISESDDRAIHIVMLETKWVLIKLMGGNAKLYGGTLTIAPMQYGRKKKIVTRYFARREGAGDA